MLVFNTNIKFLYGFLLKISIIKTARPTWIFCQDNEKEITTIQTINTLCVFCYVCVWPYTVITTLKTLYVLQISFFVEF